VSYFSTNGTGKKTIAIKVRKINHAFETDSLNVTVSG
jgi:hypothetical protein